MGIARNLDLKLIKQANGLSGPCNLFNIRLLIYSVVIQLKYASSFLLTRA